MKFNHRLPGLAATAAVCLVAAACGSSHSTSSGSSSTSAASPTTTGSTTSGGASLTAEAPASLKAQGYLTFASGATIKPLYFLDQAGKIQGEETEQTTAIASLLGLQAHFENIAFAGVLPAMASGRVDLTELTDTTAREATVDFIDFSSIYFTFVVDKGNPKNISTPASLCGTVIAQTQGTPEIKTIQGWSTSCTQSGKKPIDLLQFQDSQSSLLAVKSGRADAFLLDSQSAQQAVKNESGMTTAGHVLQTYAGFAVLKSRTDLEKAIMDAVGVAMKNGTLQNIAQKYQQQYGTSTTFLSAPVLNAASNGVPSQ